MRRGEETNSRIMKAAAELFALKGYHGTSIKDIMDKVGLTKAALYSHVTSKSDIVHQMVREYKTLYIEGLSRITDEGCANAMDMLHRLITFNYKFALNDLNKAVLIDNLSNELKSDPVVAKEWQIIHDAAQKSLADTIRLGIRQGLMNKELDADAAAAIFHALAAGMYQRLSLNHSRKEEELFARTARKIFTNGVRSL